MGMSGRAGEAQRMFYKKKDEAARKRERAAREAQPSVYNRYDRHLAESRQKEIDDLALQRAMDLQRLQNQGGADIETLRQSGENQRHGLEMDWKNREQGIQQARDQRDFTRGVLENDRDFNRQTAMADQNFWLEHARMKDSRAQWMGSQGIQNRQLDQQADQWGKTHQLDTFKTVFPESGDPMGMGAGPAGDPSGFSRLDNYRMFTATPEDRQSLRDRIMSARQPGQGQTREPLPQATAPPPAMPGRVRQEMPMSRHTPPPVDRTPQRVVPPINRPPLPQAVMDMGQSFDRAMKRKPFADLGRYARDFKKEDIERLAQKKMFGQ